MCCVEGKRQEGECLEVGRCSQGANMEPVEAETLVWRRDHDLDPYPIMAPASGFQEFGQPEDSRLQAWGGVRGHPRAVSDLWSAVPSPPLSHLSPQPQSRGSECAISQQLGNGRPTPQSTPEAAHTHLC